MRFRIKIAAMLIGAAFYVGAGAADDAQLDAQLYVAATSGEFKTPVVELYTSEGCSSCPPADNWLRKLGASLGDDFHAVPLAFHVDYWNYLGWPDPYSKPAFTARQRQAAANNRRRTIYTPAFFVNGRETRGGRGVVRAIENANAQPAPARIAVRVVRHGDGIRARVEVDNAAPSNDGGGDDGKYEARVAVYENAITRAIGGGENRGRTLTYDFVVRHWGAPVFIRRGVNRFEVDVAIPDDWNPANLGLAVVAQNRQTFATLQSVNTSLAALF